MEERKIIHSKIERLAEKFTKGLGSVASLVIHTVLFIGFFVLGFSGIGWDVVLLILTTLVSLEAIYLAIFIQMSLNKTSDHLVSVGEDIGEIAEDIEEIADDVEEIQTDVDELQEDVEGIQVDVSDIQKDIDEIQEEVDDMSDDVEVIAKGDKKGEKRDLAQKELLKSIHKNMSRVKSDLEKLRAAKHKVVTVNAPAKKISKQPSKKKAAIKKKRK